MLLYLLFISSFSTTNICVAKTTTNCDTYPGGSPTKYDSISAFLNAIGSKTEINLYIYPANVNGLDISKVVSKVTKIIFVSPTDKDETYTISNCVEINFYQSSTNIVSAQIFTDSTNYVTAELNTDPSHYTILKTAFSEIQIGNKFRSPSSFITLENTQFNGIVDHTLLHLYSSNQSTINLDNFDFSNWEKRTESTVTTYAHFAKIEVSESGIAVTIHIQAQYIENAGQYYTLENEPNIDLQPISKSKDLDEIKERYVPTKTIIFSLKKTKTADNGPETIVPTYMPQIIQLRELYTITSAVNVTPAATATKALKKGIHPGIEVGALVGILFIGGIILSTCIKGKLNRITLRNGVNGLDNEEELDDLSGAPKSNRGNSVRKPTRKESSRRGETPRKDTSKKPVTQKARSPSEKSGRSGRGGKNMSSRPSSARGAKTARGAKRGGARGGNSQRPVSSKSRK